MLCTYGGLDQTRRTPFFSGHVGDDRQTLLTFSWGGWLTKVNFNKLNIFINKVVMKRNEFQI
jgi:hypothetical protein